MARRGSEQSDALPVHVDQSSQPDAESTEQSTTEAPKEPLTLEKCEAMHKQGLELIADSKKESDSTARKNKREEGISLLSQAAEKMEMLFGQNIICAKFFYDFGRALVKQAQANNDIFSADPAGKAKEEEKVEGEEGSEGDAKEDPRDDLLVAWEVLEVARILYEKEYAKSENKEYDLALASVFTTLAELQLENEEFEQAYEDHLKSLQIQLKYKRLGDRDLAACYSDLAMIALFMGEKQVEGQALGHYREAARQFQFHILDECAKLQQLSTMPIPLKEATNSELAPHVKLVCGNLEAFEKSMNAIKEARSILEVLEEKIEELVTPVLETRSKVSTSALSSNTPESTPLGSIMRKTEILAQASDERTPRKSSSFDAITFTEKPANIVNVKRKVKATETDPKKQKMT